MERAETFCELLDRHFSLIRNLTEAEKAQLFAHYEILVRWNKVLNLSTIRRLEDVVVRHYCESLFLGSRLEKERAGSVLDVGSGGGFPGIPIAVLLPQCRVTLAESHQRKAVFLREATRSYGNVTIAAGRAKSLEGEFAWVVSRAVRWEDVVGAAKGSVALLQGEEDALVASSDNRFRWDPVVRLPWGEHRVMLVGHVNVPRET